jgi:hypothetical protein
LDKVLANTTRLGNINPSVMSFPGRVDGDEGGVAWARDAMGDAMGDDDDQLARGRAGTS